MTAFDYQPHLTGVLVEVRPLQQADFGDLYAVASDPLIWEQHPSPDRHERTAFESFFKDSIESGGAVVVIDAKTGAIIGSSRFHSFNRETREVEIGWTFLARRYWGGRYNGELKRLMLAHAFQFVDRVVLLVGPDNIRSQKAVQKVGGRRVGIRPDGGGRPSWIYEISASNFNLNHSTE